MSRDFWTLSRVISGLLALSHVALTGFSHGLEGGCRSLIACILPIVCIWFPEVVTKTLGRTDAGQTPSVMVALGGWVLLLAMIVSTLVVFRTWPTL